MKNLSKLMEMKQNGTKISMVTAYDYPSAKQAQQANIDMILVGDSLGMTVLGYDTTTQVTLDDMIHHGKAVRRGADDTFIVVDLPIGAVGVSAEHDLNHAITLYQQTNANALKAEGAHLTTSLKIDTNWYSNCCTSWFNATKCRCYGLQVTRWYKRRSRTTYSRCTCRSRSGCSGFSIRSYSK